MSATCLASDRCRDQAKSTWVCSGWLPALGRQGRVPSDFPSFIKRLSCFKTRPAALMVF